ncbi:MAG: ATP-binding protein [Cyanothece sp. SIO2G6]|nr:ATP-binding protein [Cyanothece sp. SIO2G6]
MSSSTLDRYMAAFETVKQAWAFDRLLEDLKAQNGNVALTNAQVRHLRALLAWADLRALDQLEEGDRLQHPKFIMAQILCGSPGAITTEVSRSITPCVKRLLRIGIDSKLKFAQIPALLQEKGYRHLPDPTVEAHSKQKQASNSTISFQSNSTISFQSNSTISPQSNTGSILPSTHRKLAFVSTFYGREQEQQKLNKFVHEQHSHLILVHGRGGMGKTWLVTKWLESVHADCHHLIWRRAWDRPPLTQLIWDIVQQLPGYSKSEMPDSADQQISWLIDALCTHKCLVILDDIHNFFHADVTAGPNQPTDVLTIDTTESKCYEILFEQLATNPDYQQSKSCVVAIGWYRPPILARVEDVRSPISTLELKGLNFDAAQHILAEYNLVEDEESWQQLVKKYRGSPYSLNLVGTHIRQIYDGDIASFLADETVFLGDTESLIHQQFQDISDSCKLVWLILSKEGGCTSASEMNYRINQQHQLGLSVSDMGRSLQILYERNLIEKEGDRFSPPPDVTKYALKRYQIYLPHLIKRLRLPGLG